MSSTTISGGTLRRSSGAPSGALRKRLGDRFRTVADAAVHPLTIDDVLDHFRPLRGGTELRGRVVEVRPETADAATIVIKPGKDWSGHLPGQYVRLGADVNGTRLWRTYSLTHGPRRDGNISITVKAIPGGAVSQHLVRDARPGDLLHLDQPAGDFTLPDPLPEKLLLVTAGSGITPVIGMLRNLFNRATPVAGDIVLVHSATTDDSVIFARELRQYAAAGLLTLVERRTREDGRLTPVELEGLVPDLADRSAYACGPVGLLDALEEHFTARGLELQTERFRPVVLATGEGGTVSFEKNGTEVEADGATPILDAAESAGVLMPSGCRMGICMGCVLPMKEGAVRDLRTGELTVAVPGETHADGVPIQTCINAAAGACRIDH